MVLQIEGPSAVFRLVSPDTKRELVFSLGCRLATTKGMLYAAENSVNQRRERAEALRLRLFYIRAHVPLFLIVCSAATSHNFSCYGKTRMSVYS